jgi:hypothetical protein
MSRVGALTGPVDNINNLYLKVNAAVNKLDIFARSNTAAPDAGNMIQVKIPDGNGNVYKALTEAMQLTLADANAYWGAVSGTDKQKIHVYFIWSVADAKYIVAFNRYAGFTNVPVTTTVGDDDYFLLASAYTRAATDFCVCVGFVWANYNTANTPDWTIYQTSDGAALAPQIIWNPKSDYGKQINLATSISSGGDIAEAAIISTVVKQSRCYTISGVGDLHGLANSVKKVYIKTGSGTYGSATQKASAECLAQVSYMSLSMPSIKVYLNAGDSIHLGAEVTASSGARDIYGDDSGVGRTYLSFQADD